MSGMPRSELTERAASRDDRAAHTSQGGVHGQRMRRLPYAKDRADNRGYQRPQPYLQVHSSGRNRNAQNSELLQYLPYGQDGAVGQGHAQDLAGVLAMASCAVIANSCCSWKEKPDARLRTTLISVLGPTWNAAMRNSDAPEDAFHFPSRCVGPGVRIGI